MNTSSCPTRHRNRSPNSSEGLGVELIIGGHPHVIQPMELKRSSLTGAPCLTVYSLGNFISAMRTTDTRGGAMVRVRLARDIFGKAYVSNASYRLVFTEPPVSKGDNFKILPAESRKLHNSMELHRKGFVRNAEAIFTRHNVNVPRDTADMSIYSTPSEPSTLSQE